MGGGRSCSVVGCRTRSTKHPDKHFYRYPVEPNLRDVWIKFTRRGNNYKVKPSGYICQDHFDPSCFVVKKKQIRIAKKSVPTIFYRETETDDGLEQVVLTFDQDLMHYNEEETLLNPVYDQEQHENELLAKRDEKMKAMKKLCRLCFEEADDGSLIAMSKFRDYGLNPVEVVGLVGVASELDSFFNDNACEECFQQVFVFDGYRQRCIKACERVLNEMEDLDLKLKKVQGTDFAEPWFKTESTWDGYDDKIEEFEEVIEGEEEEEEEEMPNRSYTAIEPSPSYSRNHVFQSIIVKEEENEEDCDDGVDYEEYEAPAYDMEETVHDEDEMQEEYLDPELFVKEEAVENCKTDINHFESSNIIVGVNTSQLGFSRIYECFFCQLKFAGKQTFLKHKCAAPQQLRCTAPNCGKLFTKLSGYNSHIIHLHRLPKLARLYCDFCKVSKVLSQDDFKEHQTACEKACAPVNDPPVTCEICEKVCPNMKAFAIHMMFHTTGNKSWNYESKDKRDTKWKNKVRGVFMCEQCGKEFATKRYLSDHVKRLHTNLSNNPNYICDFCGKTRKTRGLIYRHIKNVHSIEPSPCKFCGKVFRNVALLAAHMIYHKESKRIHYCTFCPDKPPYYTAVALRRHQESNHGFGNGYHCDICDATYKTKPGLSQHKMTAHGAGLKKYI